MRLLTLCTAIIRFATSQLINRVVFPRRDVYISKWVSDEHRESVYSAMSQFNLFEMTEGRTGGRNKTDNHIRIQYSNYNGGGTSMLAHSHTDGYFEVYETVIGINRLLDPVMFQCVCLHELGHAMGLGHTRTGVMAPIINYTQNYCYLDIETYIRLFNV